MRASACMSVLLLLATSSCEAIIGLHDRNVADAGVKASAGKPGSGGNGAAAGSGSMASTCEKYCQRANDTCKGEYAIYHGAADCEPACQLLTSEQIKCRDQQVSAAAASEEFEVHCQGAAFGGSSECGGNCENYCAAMDTVCTGKNRVELEKTDCVKKCSMLRDRERSLAGLPSTASRLNVDSDHEGDSLQCRLVHLVIASGPGAADSHCWHAALAPQPGPNMAPNPCATGKNEVEPHCEDYCQIAVNACTGDNKVYENQAQCVAVCKQLVPGMASDYMGDTVGCRKTHAYNALIVSQTPHCPHAGPGGAGPCGNDCPAYCRMFKAGCEASFKDAFGTAADATSKCESACTALHGPDPISYSVMSASAKGANPIACRMLHAARALERPADQATLCKSAAGEGNCKL